jgi:hypothetical protein
MRNLIIIAALVLGGAARAEPVMLWCDGEMQRASTYTGDKGHARHEMTVVIDWQAKTAKIDGFDVELFGLADTTNEKFFSGYAGALDGPKFGIDLGQLNRVTGKLSAGYVTEAGYFTFEGVCTRKILF